MGIALDEDRPSGPPSVKLRNIGDWIDIAIIDKAVVPWLEYGTNQPKIGEDGKPRTQERVTGIVVGNGGGVISVDDTDTPVTEGEQVSVYLAGHNRWEWVEANNRYRSANNRVIQVGDVLRWHFEREEKSARAGNNAKKIRTCEIYPSDDPAMVAECERLHMERKRIALDDTPATPQGRPTPPPVRSGPPPRPTPQQAPRPQVEAPF